MNDEIRTYDQISPIIGDDINVARSNYGYQKNLTSKLDVLEEDFNQDIINKIVLWKVNRYVEIDESILKLLNVIDKNNTELDVELTKKIMSALLNCSGIQLAMASTILRFKNPRIYQILDQRVYRFIYGITLQQALKEEKDQIKVYLSYLKQLKEVCDKLVLPFEESDRVLYELDKRYNKDIKLKY